VRESTELSGARRGVLGKARCCDRRGLGECTRTYAGPINSNAQALNSALRRRVKGQSGGWRRNRGDCALPNRSYAGQLQSEPFTKRSGARAPYKGVRRLGSGPALRLALCAMCALRPKEASPPRCAALEKQELEW